MSVEENDIERENKEESPPFFSYENFRTLFVLILIILIIRWSFWSPYHVPTTSMLPEIEAGDRILANKLAYGFTIPFTRYQLLKWSQIKRGDIVIFQYPRDLDQDYVKRVVAIPGDRIRLVDDILYINDLPQEREKVLETTTSISVPEDKVLFREKLDEKWHWILNSLPEKRGPNLANWSKDSIYVVPEGSVFVMGDNRDDSADSRDWGRVPISHIKGKAMFVIWSMDTEENDTWPSFKWKRFFKVFP